MAIIPVIPADTQALIDHLAEEGDHLAIMLKAIVAAIALDPSVPSYSASAEDVIDGASAPGSAASLSRGDHKHSHGNRAGGTLHPAATGSVAGFLAAADKTRLDGMASGATNTPLTSSAPVDPDTAVAAVGDAADAARANHKHHIAEAGANAGLMSPADKSKLDLVPANLALSPGTYTTITSITWDAYGRITAIAGS